jgi:hypothetical protein
VGTQLELFEAVDRIVWRQLPEEARRALCEVLADLLVRHVAGQERAGNEVGDDR